jgi:Uma2 family endonuclease
MLWNVPLGTFHPMQHAQPSPISEEQYIARERAATDGKSEFLHGRVFAMSGASPRHNLITANVSGALRTAMRDRPCVVLSSDQRVCVEPTGLYTYPDVTVVCGGLRVHPRFDDTLINPTLIVEVLSPSTEGYDRGAKFAHYRRIESLREVLLVSQVERVIEHYARQGDGSWRLTTWTERQSVPVAALGCDLALDDVYEKVDSLAPEPEAGAPRPKTLG